MTRKSFSSPALGQLSVGPIPKHVEDNLVLPACGVCEWLAEANVCADVLSAAECDLHLGYNVPVGLCSSHEIAIGDELYHGRPQAAQTMICRNALSQSGTPVNRLRRDVSVAGQSGASLELNEGVRRKQLVKGCKGFKCRRAASESAGPVSGRQDHTAEKAEDRSGAQA